ncbi:MAG: hypothetical protein ACFFE2_12065 [Candidatus Thorarchaeota archaeon]
MDFKTDDIKRLSTDNRFFNYQSSRIRQHCKNGPHRMRFCNIQIRGQQEAIDPHLLEMVALMQVKSSATDMISVPDPSYEEKSGSRLLDALNVSRNMLDQLGLDSTRIVPHLDLGTEPLSMEQRLLHLKDSGYDVIAIRYRAGKIPSAMQVTRTLSKSDIWIHLTGAPKKVELILWLHLCI